MQQRIHSLRTRLARLMASGTRRKNRTLYCDYAAATPVLPAVAARMDEIQRTVYANPSAVHSGGQQARQLIDTARQDLARTLGVRAEEVLFTASGSEANNLAILGVIEAKRAAGIPYREMEIITTRIEHPSVVRAVEHLATLGVAVRYVPVDAEGVINIAELTKLITSRTTLITFAYANSEVGTIQPVRRIVRAVKQVQPTALIHLDAAQAPLWLPCGRNQLGVDMVALDAGKCNGPKGIGVLVVRHGVQLSPIVYGGGQERGWRAGTENTAGIVGAVMAITAAQAGIKERSQRANTLRNVLLEALTAHNLPIVFNGPEDSGIRADSPLASKRLPNNVHISLPGYDTEYAVVYLDAHGIAASTKSACSGAGGGMSSVVYAMTNDTARAQSTIRFTLDPDLSPNDMPRIATILAQFIRMQNQVR